MEHRSELLDFKSQWGGMVYLSLVRYYRAGCRKFSIDMNYPDNISATEAVVELRKVLVDIKLNVITSDIAYGEYYKELIDSADTFDEEMQINGAVGLGVRIIDGRYGIEISF